MSAQLELCSYLIIRLIFIALGLSHSHVEENQQVRTGLRHVNYSCSKRHNIKWRFKLDIRYIYPMMAPSTATYGILGLAGAIVYLAYRTSVSSKAQYPPGPRPYPIIGNPFDIPPGFQEVAFAELAEKYGTALLLDIL